MGLAQPHFNTSGCQLIGGGGGGGGCLGGGVSVGSGGGETSPIHLAGHLIYYLNPIGTLKGVEFSLAGSGGTRHPVYKWCWGLWSKGGPFLGFCFFLIHYLGGGGGASFGGGHNLVKPLLGGGWGGHWW